MKRLLLTGLFSLFVISANAQIANLFKTDSCSVCKNYTGRIAFTNGDIPIEQFQKSDFLKTFNLTRKSDLNIRVFMDNSVANYLHQLAPDLTADELLKKGNLQFSFYVDGKSIYTENINYGCNFGSGGSKKTLITFRVPLMSTKGEDWWAMYMFDRFMANGGQKALSDGRHEFKLEIRPYIKMTDNGNVTTGKLIASGKVNLIVKTPKVTPDQIKIQPIQPQKDWEISDLPFDKSKIEMLNTAVANYTLKEITSIAVIRDGKLMLEEYFNDADRNTIHDTRSAGKSFTSTLMGIAIHDGLIKDENQTLKSFYKLQDFDHYETAKADVKIKDLLTMSSAFDGSDAHSDSPGNEENMYPTDNWVKFVLDLPMDHSKVNGGKWDYFTAGVVLLGDILDKNVPGGLEKYAAEKLFKPLGISGYKWQYTPQKVVNTAGSLQMTTLDYAKYAQLYKDNGIWNGQQILPIDWINKTFTKQIQITERDNQFYGYLFWNKTITVDGKNYEAFYCAGNGGNEFLIFRDLPLVVIITSKAYNKPYGHPQADTIVRDYILPAILNK